MLSNIERRATPRKSRNFQGRPVGDHRHGTILIGAEDRRAGGFVTLQHHR
jgi:hypothetical protein